MNSRQKSCLPGLLPSATVTGTPTAMPEGTQISQIGAPAPGYVEIALATIRRILAQCLLPAYRRAAPHSRRQTRQRLALRSPRSVTAASAPGKQPDDDDDDDRDQPDNEKRLEHCEDPAKGHGGKPEGEDRAEDCPDHPAHAPSMRPAPRRQGGGEGQRPNGDVRVSLLGVGVRVMAVATSISGVPAPPAGALRGSWRAVASWLAGEGSRCVRPASVTASRRPAGPGPRRRCAPGWWAPAAAGVPGSGSGCGGRSSA